MSDSPDPPVGSSPVMSIRAAWSTQIAGRTMGRTVLLNPVLSVKDLPRLHDWSGPGLLGFELFVGSPHVSWRRTRDRQNVHLDRVGFPPCALPSIAPPLDTRRCPPNPDPGGVRITLRTGEFAAVAKPSPASTRQVRCRVWVRSRQPVELERDRGHTSGTARTALSSGVEGQKRLNRSATVPGLSPWRATSRSDWQALRMFEGLVDPVSGHGGGIRSAEGSGRRHARCSRLLPESVAECVGTRCEEWTRQLGARAIGESRSFAKLWTGVRLSKAARTVQCCLPGPRSQRGSLATVRSLLPAAAATPKPARGVDEPVAHDSTERALQPNPNAHVTKTSAPSPNSIEIRGVPHRCHDSQL